VYRKEELGKEGAGAGIGRRSRSGCSKGGAVASLFASDLSSSTEFLQGLTDCRGAQATAMAYLLYREWLLGLSQELENALLRGWPGRRGGG
jgi:hypothetical protein